MAENNLPGKTVRIVLIARSGSMSGWDYKCFIDRQCYLPSKVYVHLKIIYTPGTYVGSERYPEVLLPNDRVLSAAVHIENRVFSFDMF